MSADMMYFPEDMNQDLAMAYATGFDPNGYSQMADGRQLSDNDYNHALVQMDDFLKDEGISGADSMELVNSYYNNLAILQRNKPFMFPPADLGVIESAGSLENSSKQVISSSHSHKMTKAMD